MFASYANAQVAADPVGPAVDVIRVHPEHDARRLFGAQRAVHLRRDQLRSRVPRQVRLPGHLHRLPRHRRVEPRQPGPGTDYTGCTVGQGDVVVYKNILVRSWDSPVPPPARRLRRRRLVGAGFEGIHIFDITDPKNPVFKTRLRFSTADNPEPRPAAGRTRRPPCRTRPAATSTSTTAAPTAPARDGVVKIKLIGHDRRVDREPGDGVAPVPRQHGHPRRGDELRRLRGWKRLLDLQVRHDERSGRRGRRREPDAAVLEAVPTAQHRPLVGVQPTTARRSCSAGSRAAARQPRCQATIRSWTATLFFFDTETGDEVSHAAAPAPPDQPRELHLAQLQHRADLGRQLPVSGNYQAGIFVVDFTTRHDAEGVRLRRPDAAAEDPDGARPGRRRLVDLLVQRQDLRVRHLPRHDGVGRSTTPTRSARTRSRPPTRRRRSACYAGDNAKPTVEHRGAARRWPVPPELGADRRLRCADEGLGLESCVGTVADGAHVDTSTIGYQTFTVTATDNAGNVDDASVEYVVNSTAVIGTPGATVPGDAVAVPGHGGELQRLHAGRRRDVHREHERERDLDRG